MFMAESESVLCEGGSSDRKEDAVGSFDHVELLQPDALIGNIDAIIQVKFVTVPWTDDVDVVFIVGMADQPAILVEFVDHLRHADALARRAALMRAMIVVGEILSVVLDDGDLQIFHRNDPNGAIGKLGRTAHLNFSHTFLPFAPPRWITALISRRLSFAAGREGGRRLLKQIVRYFMMRHPIVNGGSEPGMLGTRAACFSFFLLSALPCGAWLGTGFAADKFPTQPIQIIVPYAAGGATDQIARLMQSGMERRLGQPVLVINRPGASTTIGTMQVARAVPDGHTLAMVSVPHVANYTLLKKMPYAQSDFVPVTSISNTPNVLVVNPDLPIKSAADLIAYIKAHPGQVNYATFGIGSSAHLAALLFESKIGIALTAVHYRGGAPAAIGVMTGEVQMSFGSPLSVTGGITSGKLRPVAVTADHRLAMMPDVLTMREQGFDYLSGAWFGVLAPKGTPEPVVTKLHDVIAATMGQADVTKTLAQSGTETFVSSPEQFGEFIAAETKQWSVVLKNVEKQ